MVALCAVIQLPAADTRSCTCCRALWGRRCCCVKGCCIQEWRSDCVPAPNKHEMHVLVVTCVAAGPLNMPACLLGIVAHACMLTHCDAPQDA